MRKLLFIFLLLCVVSCSPSSVQDCQNEAKEVMKSLIADLKEVQSRVDLIEKGPKIERKSQTLVFLMIRLKKLQEKGRTIPEDKDQAVSDELMHEMKRIYHLEGGRELMEHFQREALLKLDAFDQDKKK